MPSFLLIGLCEPSSADRQAEFDEWFIDQHIEDTTHCANFVRGRGCPNCKNIGYKGRIAVIEAMSNYPELEEVILSRGSASQIKAIAIKCGMRTLRQNALAKAARGLSSIEEVLRVTGAD